jgi:hypothetical protein
LRRQQIDLTFSKFCPKAGFDSTVTESSASAVTTQAVIKTSLYRCNFVFVLINKARDLIFAYLLLLFKRYRPNTKVNRAADGNLTAYCPIAFTSSSKYFIKVLFPSCNEIITYVLNLYISVDILSYFCIVAMFVIDDLQTKVTASGVSTVS